MSIFVLMPSVILLWACAPTPYTAISLLKFPKGNLIREQYIGQMKRKWNKINQERVFDCKYIKVVRSLFKNDLGYEDDFYSIPFGDWVHVVPEVDGKILMVELFRFGTEDYSLEFPGGQLDKNDSPLEAAKRELIEETGYESQEYVSLGWSYPNPAIQHNKCHYYVAKNAVKTSDQDLEPAEDIEVNLYTYQEFKDLIYKGSITHSLALTASLKYLQYRDKISKA